MTELILISVPRPTVNKTKPSFSVSILTVNPLSIALLLLLNKTIVFGLFSFRESTFDCPSTVDKQNYRFQSLLIYNKLYLCIKRQGTILCWLIHNIQGVNCYYSKLKKIMNTFPNVSPKHLNKYLVLYKQFDMT